MERNKKIKMLRILVLYTRLPGYFLNGLKAISEDPVVDQITCVSYPMDNDAPYDHENFDKIKILNRNEYGGAQLLSMVKEFEPDLIFIAGWTDRTYNKIAAAYCRQINVVMGIDNLWKGTVKQQVYRVFARFILKRRITVIWVPGVAQIEFAVKLGFKRNQILTGLYSANTRFNWKRELPREPGGRRILLFVGRLVRYKRPDWLVNAFLELCDEESRLKDEWLLKLVGNGNMEEELREAAKGSGNIIFQKFVQPVDLPQVLLNADVFCLPSISEHWGVVVHEATLAGLVLLISNDCGSKSEFLIEKYNGLSFQNTSYSDFKRKLKSLLTMNSKDIKVMSENSVKLSHSVNLENWKAKLISLLPIDGL